MRYRISAEAECDIYEILDYIAQDNSAAAADATRKLMDTFERLTVRLQRSGGGHSDPCCDPRPQALCLRNATLGIIAAT